MMANNGGLSTREFSAFLLWEVMKERRDGICGRTSSVSILGGMILPGIWHRWLP